MLGDTWEEDGDPKGAAVLKQPLPFRWQNSPKSQTDGPLFLPQIFPKKIKKGTTNETALQRFRSVKLSKTSACKMSAEMWFFPIKGYFLSVGSRLGLHVGEQVRNPRAQRSPLAPTVTSPPLEGLSSECSPRPAHPCTFNLPENRSCDPQKAAAAASLVLDDKPQQNTALRLHRG